MTKIRRLVVFGDSNTYGHGLKDADNESLLRPSNKTWANIIANHYKILCVNKGIPGSGNDSILRNLHTYFLGINPLDKSNQERFNILYQPGDMVIVGLSMVYRMEIYTRGQYQRLHINNKTTLDDLLFKSFEHIMAEQELDSLNYKMIQDIHTIHTICNYYNVPYIVFRAISSNGIFTNSVKDDIFQNNKYIHKFNFVNEIMHRYVLGKFGKSILTPCNHINELGHLFWGKYLIRYIEKFYNIEP